MTIELFDYTLWTGASPLAVLFVCFGGLVLSWVGLKMLAGDGGPYDKESDKVTIPLTLSAIVAGLLGPLWTEIGADTWYGSIGAFLGEVCFGLTLAPYLTGLAALPFIALFSWLPRRLRAQQVAEEKAEEAYERGDDLAASLAPFARASESIKALHDKWAAHVKATESKLEKFRRKANREAQIEILEAELQSARVNQDKLVRLALVIWQQQQVANAYVLAETLHRQVPETPHDEVLTPELDTEQTVRAIETLRRHAKTLRDFVQAAETKLEALATLEVPCLGSASDEARRQVDELRAPVIAKVSALGADLRQRADAYDGASDSLEVVKLQLERPAMDRVPLPPELASVLPATALDSEQGLELPNGIRQVQETLGSLIAMPSGDLSDDLLDEYLLRCQVDLEAVGEVYAVGEHSL